MNKITLYKNAKHGISRWSVWSSGNTIYMSSESKIGDTPLRFTENVPKGLAGRTLEQQIELRMKARIRGKRDNGYVDTMEEAKNPLLKNTMGFYQPMLAQKIQDVRHFDEENYFAQPKLDGHRCMITREGSEIIAYSRRGREITTIDHITSQIDIPDGVTLDGELYCHGMPLQTIASWAKRQQAGSKKLQYVIYDVVEPETTYEERLTYLFEDLKLPVLKSGNTHYLLQTVNLPTIEYSMKELFDIFREEGYEGLILRDREFAYEVGRRSKGLIKVKETHDAEYEVTDVTASKWNWGVLHCRLPTGTTFKVAAPGTLPEKEQVLLNKNHYIGQHVTVEYAHLTKDGVPFHPVATRWRLDI